jgi:hypothetical protein
MIARICSGVFWTTGWFACSSDTPMKSFRLGYFFPATFGKTPECHTAQASS